MSTFSDRKEPFTAEEHATWADIVALHRERRDVQLCSLFLDGVRRLEFDRPTLPELGECRHALLGEPVPFEVERICAQEFRIDQMQPRLFVLQSPEQLSASFEKLQAIVRA